MKSPFHAGELAVQERAAVRQQAEHGGRMVRDAMPDQHREFFENLLYVVVAAIDDDGFPRATMLVGPPGFVSSPDDRTLAVDAWPATGDPIAAGIAPGKPIGVLGIELETRRRNRANGRAIAATAGVGFAIAVDESFGNCPQYIQARTPLSAVRRASATTTTEAATLSLRARGLIQHADTLFIASASSAGRVDVSHRGGKPGFVKVADEGDHTVLTMPDFAGNNFFMTLGNLEQNPRAGIAIVDFASGDMLSLVGTTTTIWDGPDLASFEGARRLVRFTVAGGTLLPAAIPLTWSAPGYARQLERTGSW